MTTTEEVLSRLNKKTKDRVRLASEMSIERLELPSPALTRALNGGLGYGRQSLIWGTKSAGKAQPTNLVIPTPSGDKKFGDIKVGDYVWGGDGNPVEVIATHKQGVLPCYRVSFSDGTETYCNDKHLWTVQTIKQRYGRGRNGKRLNNNWRTVQLSDIINSGLTGQFRSSYKFYLPPQPLVQFQKNSELPIDPYMLGCILGDGSVVSDPGITVGFADDPVIINIINSRQSKYKLNRKVSPKSTAVQYSILNIRDALRSLNLYGLYSYEKHIPSVYMESSVEDRIALLQGILDTDGHVSKTAPHKAKLTSSSRMLIDQTAELVRSLGGYAYENSVDNRSRPVYSLAINTPFNPFMMPRKRDKYIGKESFRAFADIEEVEPAEMMCITVNNKDGLYLSNDFIVTHNSSLCLQAIADAQKKGKVCAWIDAEQAFDREWAKRLGVDTDALIVSPTKTIAGMTEIATDLMQAGIDVVVVDSISTLLPQAFFEKVDPKKSGEPELKDFTGTNKIGSKAVDMANSMAILNYANTNTALILISQVRNKIYTGGAVGAPTGGNATLFNSSTSIKLTASAAEKDQIKEEIYIGTSLVTRPVAREVNWLVDWNKLAPMLRSGKYEFYYEGDHIGVDTVGDLFRTAVEFGIIHKGGVWYSIDDHKWQGMPAGIAALRNDPELMQFIGDNLV